MRVLPVVSRPKLTVIAEELQDSPLVTRVSHVLVIIEKVVQLEGDWAIKQEQIGSITSDVCESCDRLTRPASFSPHSMTKVETLGACKDRDQEQLGSLNPIPLNSVTSGRSQGPA